MKHFVFSLIFIYSMMASRAFGQCLSTDVGAFTNACSGLLPASTTHCPTWTDACGSGWIRSNGSPQMLQYTTSGPDGSTFTHFVASMNSSISTSNSADTTGAGMFTPFTFQQGTWYDVKIDFNTQLDEGQSNPSNPQAYGYAKFYAANGLVEHPYDGCADKLPNPGSAGISTQLIGSFLGITPLPIRPGGVDDFSYTFQAGSNYSQFWAFPYATSINDYDLNVYHVAICPSCTATANYPTGTLPTLVAGGTVTIGGGPAGSSVVPASLTASTTITAGQAIQFEPGFSASVSDGGSLVASIVPCGTYGSTLTAADAFDSLTIVTPPVFNDSSSIRNAAQAGTAATFNSSDSSYSKLLVYPTVSTGAFTLTGGVNDLCNASIIVFDQSGRVVYEMYNEANTSVPLNLGNLSGGLYFIRVSESARTTTLKIIISK